MGDLGPMSGTVPSLLLLSALSRSAEVCALELAPFGNPFRHKVCTVLRGRLGSPLDRTLESPDNSPSDLIGLGCCLGIKFLKLPSWLSCTVRDDQYWVK